MPALIETRTAVRLTAILVLLHLWSGVFPLFAVSKDFDIPLKELKSSGNSEFDIPLSDLKKGERKKSRKQDDSRRKDKKKSADEDQVKSDDKPDKSKTDAAVPPLQPPETAAVIPSLPDEFQIIHEPYSFVVGGKRTIINAVVTSSQSAIQTVRCRFRATEGGGFAQLQMTKAAGSLYTYTATLPPLSKNTGTLRYSVTAVDSLHREIRSQEYVVPVKMTLVVPGWQLDVPKEKIVVQLENPAKPLEGFNDVTVEEVKPAKKKP